MQVCTYVIVTYLFQTFINLLSSYGTCTLHQAIEQLNIHFSFWQFIGKSIFDSTDESQSMFLSAMKMMDFEF